jgi:hypothetical protein
VGIKEIQAAGNLLSGCSFSHIKWEANQAAHELSQRALRKEPAVVMRFRVPLDVCERLEKERLVGMEGSSTCNLAPT